MTYFYKTLKLYSDIRALLFQLSKDVKHLLPDNLIGLYLFGSLTYGDFNPDSSDIDLVAIIHEPLKTSDLDSLRQLHKQLGEKYSKWRDRLECSCIPIDFFGNILPPKIPRPYYGGGVFYEEAPYGNEWIINNYLLYNHGIALLGPDFKELIKPIAIIEVQKACIRDLFEEWEPKIRDVEWLDNSHYQSYLVLNLCRILYTVFCGVASTKKVSAEWVKNKFGMPYKNLIETAESWKYGDKMNLKDETIDFIKFTIKEIRGSNLYKLMYASE